jgi:formamidopyrimidine-DNA glycosylase
MPEMPEVEITRRGLAAPLRGARVLAVHLGKPLRWPLGCTTSSLVARVAGELVRRGKYLWLPLQGATQRASGGLLMHLGMSGSLAWWPLQAGPAPAKGPHDHFEMVTDRGTLRLTDPRRFGAVLWSHALDEAPAAPLLARLGAEPLDESYSPQAFHAALQRCRCAIKSVLLAGDVVVGAGNIYACEALFQAGIHPAARADRLGPVRARRLLLALRATLARALDLGGSTLRNFSDAHGVNGSFQGEAAVYGREGQACVRCAAPIRRIVQGQRSSYFCPVCQRK